MDAKHLVAVFFLGALVSGGVTWLVMRGTRTDVTVDGVPREAASSGAETGIPAEPRAMDATPPADPTLTGTADAPERFHDLQAENRELQEQVETLEARVEELQPPPRDPRAFRFGIPGQAPSFDKAAWKDLSVHMTELTGILSELKDSLVAGNQPTSKEISRIVKHNTPLATFAVAFGSDLEDPNPNGAYTHPAVIANLMRSALVEKGLPLSDDQEIAIQALGGAWVGDQERAMASLPADTPVLSKTVLEVDAKLRFLESAKRVLSQQQRDVLFPVETEGRLKLDLLSPALAYVLSFPCQATDAEDMRQKVVVKLFEQAGIEVEDLAPFEWVGREWVDSIPGADVPIDSRSVDHMFPHVNIVQTRARAQAAAMERILAMRTLTEEQDEELRQVGTLLHPHVLK